MKPLPSTEQALVLRTDFSDDDAWAGVCDAIMAPDADGFQAYVECVSDPTYTGTTVAQLVALAATNAERAFVFVVDQATLTDPERPILVVDLLSQPGRTFRVTPGAAAAVENNLSIANMDFAEFADNVDADGVFRGFPK